MIELTRLRHDDVFFLNPDLIERIDCHVDTVVRLTNGSEYLVSESGEQIIARIVELRARVLALVPLVRIDLPGVESAEPVEPAGLAAALGAPDGEGGDR